MLIAIFKVTKTMKNITTISIFLIIIFATQKIFADTHYASKTGGNNSPYTSWANAATTIQNAVNAASPGDTVLVNDGTYYPGSEIIITNLLNLRSVNGAVATIVDGGNSADYGGGASGSTINNFLCHLSIFIYHLLRLV